MECWKDACGVYTTLLTLFRCVDPITCDQRSMPVSARSHFALLPDEKKGVYITKPPFKCNHTFFGCVCEASTRAFEIYCSHFYNYIVYVYFTLYFVSLIDTDTSPSFVRRAELRGNAHVFFLFLVVFHGILFGFASFLQVFISFFLILFGFFLLHSYNLFVLLYKLLLCKK